MLPCRHVIHTVAPRGGQPKADENLSACYKSCLDQVEELGLESLAFCCLGTGIFHFPNVRAAHIALSSAREWLESRAEKGKPLAQLVFCVFDEVDVEAYLRCAPHYFPKEPQGTSVASASKDAAPSALTDSAGSAPAGAAPSAPASGSGGTDATDEKIQTQSDAKVTAE
eukprot:gnl/TRDRNA2_/TRDRNA2_156189_c0_seq1.p1 gnl/TRDRNA2_/TRDRNA2_156189_c0~~gnl/TRDRNA2_/TRDRNA2_156189_c0_seq1.p1  ORF type:complete len:169 (-),score=17.07 gnl/TRDRNA2_/TRDRNA2_156189_c0_seq1:311-817(-)